AAPAAVGMPSVLVGVAFDGVGDVAVAGVDDDGFAAGEVGDLDGSAVDFGQGAVAAVDGVPYGAADGGGAVASAGAVAAVGAGVEGLQHPSAEAGGVGVCGEMDVAAGV